MATVQHLAINRSVARRPRVIRARISRAMRALVAATIVLLVGAALVYAGQLALTHFLRHPSFVIRHVYVVCRGVRTVPDADIVARARIVSNMNIYATSLAPMEERLRQHPDIAAVEIAKRPPDALVITFSEREPVAVLKLPGAPHDVPIDRAGVMLSKRKLPYASRLPVIEGLTGITYKPGAVIDDPRVPPALQFVDTLRRMQHDLFLDITSIQFGNPRHVTLKSASIDEIRLGATYSLNDVLRLLKTVETLRAQRRNARCIDLRFADVVVIPYNL